MMKECGTGVEAGNSHQGIPEQAMEFRKLPTGGRGLRGNGSIGPNPTIITGCPPSQAPAIALIGTSTSKPARSIWLITGCKALVWW